MKCPTCRGSGRFPLRTMICPVCDGDGSLPDDRIDNDDCPVCGGSGKYPLRTMVCSKCDGWGKLPGPPPARKKEGGSTILLVEARKPRTAHADLETLLAKLRGDVKVCDPFYGTGTLHRLACMKACDSVCFLTRQPDSKEKSYVDRAFKEFKNEFGQFEFRKHRGPELHDRYVLASDRLLILGHGLKDIGTKESFIIQLAADFASDIIATVSSLFDQKWAQAELIA